VLEGEEDVQVPWLFLFSSRLKRTEEEEGVPGLGLRKKNKMGLSGEPGPRGKWKERKKKIEVGMVQIGLGHNYKIIFLCVQKF
jgi:hypothetical protein